MKKIKNTPTLRHKITTIFGYSLFVLMALSFFLTTMLPMTFALQYPTARHFNIIVLIIVFAVATILPALTAYFIGDKSTHSKKDTLHHYNGVLFGFAAYWIAMLMSWVGFNTVFGVSEQPYPIPLIATNVAPVVLTIIVMIILAIIFAKKQKKNTSVLQFLPYQLVLIISIVGTFTVPYISDSPYVTFASIAALAIPAVVTAMAYIVLRNQKLNRLARLSDALIAMTIGWISVWIAQSCFSFSQLPYQAISIVSYVIALIILGVYLYLRVRK
jgi:hypothetical protein